MNRLGKIAVMALFVLSSGRLAAAQDFVTNCTWKTAKMSGSVLGMYCHNDNWAHFSYDWTWFDTAYCVINNGGIMAAYPKGNYWPTCRDCSFNGTKADFILNCTCYDVDSTTKHASYDLNKIIWNHNGSLGCFHFIGNKTKSGPN